MPQHDDITTEERNQIFAPLASFPRCQRLQYWQVRHAPGCNDRIVFSTEENAGPLHWMDFREFQGAAAEIPGSRVEAIVHAASCPRCRSAVYKTAFRVVAPRGDRFITREYEVPGPPGPSLVQRVRQEI